MKQFFADFVESFIYIGKMTLTVLVLCALVFGVVVGAIGLVNLAIWVAGGNVLIGSLLAIAEFVFVSALICAGHNYLNTWWSQRCRRKQL